MRGKSSKRVTEIRALRTHTQSLSGRSLGCLDRAAALPGRRAAAKAFVKLQEASEKCSLGEKTTGVPFRVVIVAAFRGPLLPYSPNLFTLAILSIGILLSGLGR